MKYPESLIYARFRVFFVQCALRGGRCILEKPQIFNKHKNPAYIHG